MIDRRAVLALGPGLMLGGRALADEPTSFPFRVTRNRPWTGVVINGKPAVPFLLDSGAGGFAIMQGSARKHGLVPVTSALARGVTGRADLPVYQIDDLTIGGAFSAKEVMIVGLPDRQGDEMEGLLPPAFADAMEFNFETQRATIYRNHTRRPSGFEIMKCLRTVSLEYENDKRMVIDCKLDGIPLRLLVDTGATSTVFLFPDFVRANSLWDRYERSVGSRAQGATQGLLTKLARAEKLEIGKFVFDNPVIDMGSPDDHRIDGTRRYHGLIGMEILRRFDLLLDPQKLEVGFRPNGKLADVYRYDRGGVQIRPVNGEVRATGVRPDGPAAQAGMRPGDKVVGWRGQGGYQDMTWALMGAAGSTVSIQIERAGERRMIDIVLADRF